MTDRPSTWQRTTTRRFLKWLFSWRTARRALISFAVLVTLIGLFYAEEDFRGKHAWDNYRRQLEARGEQLDWNAYIPKPIPDNQNFAATPLIQAWFERIKPHYESWSDRKNKPAEDCYGQAEINVAEAQTKGEYSFRRRNSSLERGDRHFLDLVAWGSAFDAIRAGTFSKRQKIEAGKLDLESRAKAAPSVLEGLKTNEAMFAELRAASQRPYCRYAVNYNVDNPAEILLPHLNRIRVVVCRRLLLKACAELAAGRSDKALNDVNLMFYMADSLKEEPFVISYLVRSACLGIAIQPIWEGLAEHHWTDLQLQQLQMRLKSYDLVQDLKRPLDSERAAAILTADLVRRKGLGTLIELTSNGNPIDPFDRNMMQLIGYILPTGWLYLEQLNFLRLYEIEFAGVDNKRISPTQVQSNERQVNQEFRGGKFSAFLHHRLLAAILTPAIGGVRRKAAMTQTAVDEAAIACVLERYRLAKGQFPDELDALVPAFVSQLPHDVITGEPYKYRRTNDDQFVLYSVGWNEKDDGGVPGKTLFDEKEGDWVWEYPKL